MLSVDTESERIARHGYDRQLARRGCASDVKHAAAKIEASVQPLLAARCEEGPHATKRTEHANSLIAAGIAYAVDIAHAIAPGYSKGGLTGQF